MKYEAKLIGGTMGLAILPNNTLASLSAGTIVIWNLNTKECEVSVQASGIIQIASDSNGKLYCTSENQLSILDTSILNAKLEVVSEIDMFAKLEVLNDNNVVTISKDKLTFWK